MKNTVQACPWTGHGHLTAELSNPSDPADERAHPGRVDERHVGEIDDELRGRCHGRERLAEPVDAESIELSDGAADGAGSRLLGPHVRDRSRGVRERYSDPKPVQSHNDGHHIARGDRNLRSVSRMDAQNWGALGPNGSSLLFFAKIYRLYGAAPSVGFVGPGAVTSSPCLRYCERQDASQNLVGRSGSTVGELWFRG
jgi:hypothetical protein